jgi:hypothetical protein
MNNYKAFYRNKTVEVQAETSYKAQQIASKLLKAKKTYDVTVLLLDTIHNPAIL